MSKQIDLTTGSISGKLIKLSIPIMGVSFIQTAYSLIDMIWIGKIGASATAAVGTAGLFTWLAEAFIMLSKLGASIKVSQSMGRREYDRTKNYITSALQMNLVIACIYGLFLLAFNKPLIGFFNLGEADVISMARTYLIVVSIAMPFFFTGPVFSAIFNSIGDSKTPFIINTIGLVFNIVFDPILIFGYLGFPEMGVLGAALATVLAQIIVTLCFIIITLKRKISYFSLKLWVKPKWEIIKEIAIIGVPGGVQSGIYTTIAMILGRIIAGWGADAIAAQKIGSQIESISWMTAGGFSTAVSTYVGQNFGAGKKDRIQKGITTTLFMALGVGAFATILLVLAGDPLMRIFIDDVNTINIGKEYLLILGYSQLFMCIEITIAGAFNGLGRTYLPNAITIVLTAMRIPLALVLAEYMGLNGVWWSISITSVVKGIVLMTVYLYLKGRNKLIRFKDVVAVEE